MSFVLPVLCAGCSVESFGNLGRNESPRPASAITGATYWTDPKPSQLGANDSDGNPMKPCDQGRWEIGDACFNALVPGPSSYEVQLPSSKYSMIEATGRAGSLALRAIVPSIGEETTASSVDLDARNVTETLIVEANLSARGLLMRLITPTAYLGTRNLIRADLDQPGPTQDLLHMVERLLTQIDPLSGQTDPDFFAVPEMNEDFTVKTSPLSLSFLQRTRFDYDGDGKPNDTTEAFDTKLGAAAQLYKPEGCLDPSNVRVVFTVDFNASTKDGNCASVNRFKWATDKPGKSMFFVGWVHKESPLQDKDFPDLKPSVSTLLGSSTPNQIQMYDDGTNGDQVAGDNIYTVSFIIPKGDPAAGSIFRIGYKFTWGTKGALWTGSEEWPGNSRILEIVDVNGDGFVYRHEVFGDEATNKDRANQNNKGTGIVTWTTDMHGCGPEARENTYDFNTCSCGSAIQTPKGIGPINVACTQ